LDDDFLLTGTILPPDILSDFFLRSNFRPCNACPIFGWIMSPAGCVNGLMAFWNCCINFFIGFFFLLTGAGSVAVSTGRWSWSSRFGFGCDVIVSPLSVT